MKPLTRETVVLMKEWSYQEQVLALLDERDALKASRRGMREFEVTQETIGKLDDARAALVMALPLLKQAGVLPGSERAIAVAAIEACLLK